MPVRRLGPGAKRPMTEHADADNTLDHSHATTDGYAVGATEGCPHELADTVVFTEPAVSAGESVGVPLHTPLER